MIQISRRCIVRYFAAGLSVASRYGNVFGHIHRCDFNYCVDGPIPATLTKVKLVVVHDRVGAKRFLGCMVNPIPYLHTYSKVNRFHERGPCLFLNEARSPVCLARRSVVRGTIVLRFLFVVHSLKKDFRLCIARLPLQYVYG